MRLTKIRTMRLFLVLLISSVTGEGLGVCVWVRQSSESNYRLAIPFLLLPLNLHTVLQCVSADVEPQSAPKYIEIPADQSSPPIDLVYSSAQTPPAAPFTHTDAPELPAAPAPMPPSQMDTMGGRPSPSGSFWTSWTSWMVQKVKPANLELSKL